MTEIILCNKANIKYDVKYLKDALQDINFPEGVILLVLNENALPNNVPASCISSELTQFSEDYHQLFKCLIENGLSSQKWDCCIFIAKEWCYYRTPTPAYFDFILGHELGHAYIALTNLQLGKHCAVVFHNIKSASKGAIQNSYEFPYEKRCDQFGIFFSQQIHGERQFDLEIDDLIKLEHKNEDRVNRLQMLKGLTPRGDMDGLRNELIDFSMPYKDELIKLWEKEAERDDGSLAGSIGDFDELFKY